MLAGDPLTVFRNDDGSEPSRDFTFVTDIVKGINAALNLAAPLEVFNLGNNSPEPVSVMIGALEKGLGITAVKTYAPVTGGMFAATPGKLLFLFLSFFTFLFLSLVHSVTHYTLLLSSLLLPC